MKVALLVVALVAILAVTAMAQDEPEAGSFRFITTVQPELYIDDESGNQAWVREYDMDYNGFDLGVVDSVGYTGPWQYQLNSRDVLTGQYLIDTSFGFGYDVSGNIELKEILHRLDWIPTPELGITPVSSQPTYIPVVTPQPTITSTNVDIADINLGWRLPLLRSFRLVGQYWAEDQEGEDQILWRGRSGFISNQRASSIQPIDRHTKEPGIGFDSQLSPTTAFSYRFLNTKFNGTNRGPELPGLPNELIAGRTEVDTDTDTHDFRLSSNLSDTLALTGFLTLRDREHKTADVNVVEFGTPPTFIPVGTDVEANINTGDIVLDYTPSPAWYARAGFYRSDYDLDVPAIVDPTAGGIMNQAISWEDTRTFIDANYTGIRRWTFGLGYEFRDIDRNGRDPHGEHEEFSHALFFDNSKHNIIRLRINGRPTNDLSFSLVNKFDSVDTAGYRGTGTSIWDLNANVTYSPSVKTAINLGWQRRDEENNQIPALPLIPAPTDPDYEDLREFISGADYNNTVDTFYLGWWQALSSKLWFNLNYGRDEIDSSAIWVLGIDPRFLPHLPPFSTPFEATSNVYDAGLTYNLNERWVLRGNFTYVDSFGKSLPNILQLTRPGEGVVNWHPISRKDTAWAISAGYQLNRLTQLDLEFSSYRWNDNVDPENYGRYNVITLAAVRRF